MTNEDLDEELKPVIGLQIKASDDGKLVDARICNVYDDELAQSSFDIKIASDDKEIVLRSITSLITTCSEELDKEQTEILKKCSLELSLDGYYRDENTGITFGHQDQLDDIISRINSVSDKSRVKEEMKIFKEMFSTFSEHFAQCMMIKQSKDGN